MVNLHFGSSLVRFALPQPRRRYRAATRGVARTYLSRKMENDVIKIISVRTILLPRRAQFITHNHLHYRLPKNAERFIQ